VGLRGRAGRWPASCLELVQGAIATDLIPRYNQGVSELDRAIRTTATARLETAKLDLEAVGSQYYATALAVTGRTRATLSAEEHEALSKALYALGWRPPEIALLCIPPVIATSTSPVIPASEPESQQLRSLGLAGMTEEVKIAEETGMAQVLAAYARALNAEALILLERDLLSEPPKLPWIKIATCDDFFGSLDDQNKKRTAWIQLQTARRISTLVD